MTQTTKRTRKKSAQSLQQRSKERGRPTPGVQAAAMEPMASMMSSNVSLSRRNRKARKGAAGSARLSTILMACALGVCLAIFGFQLVRRIGASSRFKPKTIQKTQAAPVFVANASNVPLKATALTLDEPETKKALAVVENYRALRDWRAQAKLVYAPERAEPRMKAYYEDRKGRDPLLGDILSAQMIKGGGFSELLLIFACPERVSGTLNAYFDLSPDGSVTLDWESYVGYGDVSWTQLKDERSALPRTMRVFAKASDYYNYEFSDKNVWQAVKLRSSNGAHSVIGYVRKEDAIGLAISNLIGVFLPHRLAEEPHMPPLAIPGTEVAITVKLSYPASAESDQCVEIKDLVTNRWLLLDGEE
jgi:hypothetical protein